MFFSNGCQSLLWMWLANASTMAFIHYFVVVDVNSPFFPLDGAFLPVDAALSALLDDISLSSLVRDEDANLEAPDVHFHSSFAIVKCSRNAVESDDEDAMVGVVVLEMDEEPGWAGDGDLPCCPLLVSSDVVGVVVAVKGTAAAAVQQVKAWLEEVDVVAAAAAGPVVAMAAATADCLDVGVNDQCEAKPDVKAETPSDVGGRGVCQPDVEEACCRCSCES